MDIKLIAVDLDGTLLNEDRIVSDKDKKALLDAMDNGIIVVPVTGRQLSGVRKALGGLFDSVRYIIAVNGAQIRDMQNNEMLFRTDISPEEAEEVYDYLDSLPVIYEAFQDEDVMMPSEHFARFDEYSMRPGITGGLKAIIKPIGDFRNVMKTERLSMVKIQALFNDPKLRLEQLEEIPRRFPNLLVTSAQANNIEISGKDASKGSALKVLCAHLQIELKEAMAIGDNINDISMLSLAGVSIAMGNASEDVCQGVTYVTGSNTESGVAEAINKFAL